MLQYVTRRLLQAVLTVFGVLTVAFFLVRLSGDPLALMLPEIATAEDIEELRAALGLDRPLWVQYTIFLTNAVQGTSATRSASRCRHCHSSSSGCRRHSNWR